MPQLRCSASFTPHFPALGECVKSVSHKSMSASKKGEGRMISRREFIAATGAAVTVFSVGGAAIPESAAGGGAKTAGAPRGKKGRPFFPHGDSKTSTPHPLSPQWDKHRPQMLSQK